MNRNDIIIDFFKYIDKDYQYAIIHHVDDLFDEEGDIDLIIDCSGKKKLEQLVSGFCSERGFYYVRHTIDLGAERYNIICFNDLDFAKIELDITHSAKNILGLKIGEVLNRKESTLIKGHPINRLKNEDDYEAYLKKKAFKQNNFRDHLLYFQRLVPNKTEENIAKEYKGYVSYFKSLAFRTSFYYQKAMLLLVRIKEKPCKTIAILGPDGSGKTTVINALKAFNPYVNFNYYHLKPIRKKNEESKVETNPHGQKNYSQIISYIKLIYLFFQYHIYWILNIFPDKIKPMLIVFDRYFDDIFADPKRYRYSGSGSVVKLFRRFIPGPDITFILDAPEDVIFSRKREVTQEQLSLQLEKYRRLGNKKNYYLLNVDRSVNAIIKDILVLILKKKGNE